MILAAVVAAGLAIVAADATVVADIDFAIAVIGIDFAIVAADIGFEIVAEIVVGIGFAMVAEIAMAVSGSNSAAVNDDGFVAIVVAGEKTDFAVKSQRRWEPLGWFPGLRGDESASFGTLGAEEKKEEGENEKRRR